MFSTKTKLQVSKNTILNDADILKNIDTVSTFISESQKQHFESMKFSLNIWVIINSGAAIALIGKGIDVYNYSIKAFLFGALFSAIGNMIMYITSCYKFYELKKFIFNDISYKNYIINFF